MKSDSRTPLQGLWTIVRFNWPLYATAFAALAVCVALLVTDMSGWLKVAAALGAGGCLWFLAGSLGASHWVYDRSRLYKWDWLGEIDGVADRSEVLLCHTGFDEFSQPLRRVFPRWNLRVLDHYDPALMTEASIRRARRAFRPDGDALSAPFDAWPAVSADLVLGILAIHELRSETERTAWFREAENHLTPGGQVVLVEHARDPANFIAFGPGFLHFHTVSSWRRCWEAAGFQETATQRITPFVRVFVLQCTRSPSSSASRAPA